MKKIEMETWYRKDYYAFFKSFKSPIFGKTIQVDVEPAYQYCKKNGHSFFLYSLYVFLRACNEIPQFRHREINGDVYDMEQLYANTPVMIPGDENHQFTIVDAPYFDTFAQFQDNAKKVIGNAQAGVTPVAVKQNEQAMVSLNCSPWFSYTGATFAYLDWHQSMPLLDWGKYEQKGTQKMMPYCIRANHAFIDGYHMGQFASLVQKYFQNPEMI